jgi:methanogenic corrinoid protein MtbC1
MACIVLNITERNKVKIIIGGCSVTEVVCNYVGADAFTDDAPEGVKLCKKFVVAN